MSKVNPKKIPRSEADVIKARAQGYNEGIRGALTIMLYTLKDKFSYTDEQLKVFSDAFNYTVDGINRNYIKPKDLQMVIWEEYGTTVELK